MVLPLGPSTQLTVAMSPEARLLGRAGHRPGSHSASAHHCLAGGGSLLLRKSQQAKAAAQPCTARGQAWLQGVSEARVWGCLLHPRNHSLHAPFPSLKKLCQEGGDLDHMLRGQLLVLIRRKPPDSPRRQELADLELRFFSSMNNDMLKCSLRCTMAKSRLTSIQITNRNFQLMRLSPSYSLLNI